MTLLKQRKGPNYHAWIHYQPIWTSTPPFTAAGDAEGFERSIRKLELAEKSKDRSMDRGRDDNRA